MYCTDVVFVLYVFYGKNGVSNSKCGGKHPCVPVSCWF